MALQVTQMWVPSSKYNIKCPYSMDPQYITVHNTANDASAMSEISYMISNNNKVSYHVAIDDYRAVQGIPFNRNAWHAGDGNGNGNRNSIGIEICYSLSGGSRFDAAEKNAAYYIACLLKERGWEIDRVKRHYDWSGKNCPHRTIDKGWTIFLNMIQSYLGEGSIITPIQPPSDQSIEQVARDVIAGKYGNGDVREAAIKDAGYDYEQVQAKVNELLKQNGGLATKPTQSIEQIARDVIIGKYGDGEKRKKNIQADGYDYDQVQAKVNQLLKQSNESYIDKIARDVIAGKYGDGSERRRKLEAAGYNYEQVQARVNQLL